MAGLTPGRIVLFVFDEQSAAEVMRRRTSAGLVADRMRTSVPSVDGPVPSIWGWPSGAQAHIGNDVHAGDICPAMVVATFGGDVVNLKVMLDGSDTYWATSVHHSDEKLQRSWHWMFAGQEGRYTPAATQPPSDPPATEETAF